MLVGTPTYGASVSVCPTRSLGSRSTWRLIGCRFCKCWWKVSCISAYKHHIWHYQSRLDCFLTSDTFKHSLKTCLVAQSVHVLCSNCWRLWLLTLCALHIFISLSADFCYSHICNWVRVFLWWQCDNVWLGFPVLRHLCVWPCVL